MGRHRERINKEVREKKKALARVNKEKGVLERREGGIMKVK